MASLSKSNCPPNFQNYSQSLLNEIKKFNKNVNQLNILLKETKNACDEIKLLENPSQISGEMKTIQINDKDENFIKSLQMHNICLVILGQTSSAKALLVNQLLDRKLFPFDVKNFIKQDNWRFIRIKHGKVAGYSYQLVDSDFEVMRNQQINKKSTFTTQNNQKITSKLEKDLTSSHIFNSATLLSTSSQTQMKGSTNHGNKNSSCNFEIPLEALCLDDIPVKTNYQFEISDTDERTDNRKLEILQTDADNQAILEVTLDLKILENNVEIILHSQYMSNSIFDYLLHNVFPIFLFGIVENQLSEKDIKELESLRPHLSNHPIFFVKVSDISKDFDLKDQINRFKQASNLQSQNIREIKILKQLRELKYLTDESICNSCQTTSLNTNQSHKEPCSIKLKPNSEKLLLIRSEFCDNWQFFIPLFCSYLKNYFKLFSVEGATILFKFHEYCLSRFIKFAFEMVFLIF